MQNYTCPGYFWVAYIFSCGCQAVLVAVHLFPELEDMNWYRKTAIREANALMPCLWFLEASGWITVRNRMLDKIRKAMELDFLCLCNASLPLVVFCRFCLLHTGSSNFHKQPVLTPTLLQKSFCEAAYHILPPPPFQRWKGQSKATKLGSLLQKGESVFSRPNEDIITGSLFQDTVIQAVRALNVF